MDRQRSLTKESAKLGHNHPETSRHAALKIAPKAGTIRRRVLAALVAAGPLGLTDDEIADVLMCSPNTSRPRRLELVEGGWVTNSSREAWSFSGNKAIAWVAMDKATLLIENTRNNAS